MICPNCHRENGLEARFCSSCGAVMSAAPAPAPAPTAAHGAPLPPPTFAPPSATAVATPAVVSPDVPLAAHGGAPKPSRKGLLVGVGAGVALAAGVAYFAFGSDSSDAGSASPEAAVTELAGALDAEDYVGALTYLAPDESAGLESMIEALQQQAADQGVKGMSRGEGIDMSFEVSGASVDELADDAAAVDFTLTGGVAATESASGPMGEAFRNGVDFEVDMRLITVKLDGRWYVSPMLSLAEVIVDEADLPSGDFDAVSDSDRGTKANSATDAVEMASMAIFDQDVDSLAAVVAPGEARLLRVYRDAIDSMLVEANASMSFDDVSVSSADGGAVIDDLSFTYYDYDMTRSVRYHNGCFEQDGEETACLSELYDTFGLRPDDIVWRVHQADGGYRVGLVETVTTVMAGAMSELDRSTVLDALGAQYLDEADPIEVGSTATATIPEGGRYHVWEFQAEAGVMYGANVTSYDCWSSEYHYTDDGGWQYAWLYGEAPGAGPVRVVVECSTGSGPVEADLTVFEVQTSSTTFPLDISGDLLPGETRYFEFDVLTDSYFALSYDGLSWAAILNGTGPESRYNSVSTLSDGSYYLSPGSYTLQVGAPSDGGGSFSVQSSETAPPVLRGFDDGSYSMIIDLSSGAVTLSFNALMGDSIDVTATPYDGQDITLTANECSDCGTVDYGYAGQSESINLTVQADGTYTITIDGYGGENYFGTVEVTLYFN